MLASTTSLPLQCRAEPSWDAKAGTKLEPAVPAAHLVKGARERRGGGRAGDAHLRAVLLPQGRDELLHRLVLHGDLIHMQVHAVPEAQLLQLLQATKERRA